MIPIIPYKHYTFFTSLSIEQAAKLVSNAIAPRRTLQNWMASNEKGFEGTVNERGFKIEKTHYNRNSFIPVLYGKFKRTNEGTEVTVHLTMHVAVLIFSAFWMAFCGGAFLLLYIDSLQKGRWNSGLWDVLAIIGFFVGLTLLGFAPTAQATDEFITSLFVGCDTRRR